MRISLSLRPLLLAPLLAGCAMGPNYAPPSPPKDVGARFVRADEVSPQTQPSLAPWWRELDDALLSTLIEEALAASPTIEAAQARVEQARAQANGARAAFAPVAGAGAAIGDMRAPALVTGGPAQSTSVFMTGFDALWEVDVFGGQRRGLEGAKARLEGSRADADNARLSLSAEVARQYLGVRAAQERLALARRALTTQERITALTAQLQTAGKVSLIERQASERALEGQRRAVMGAQAGLNDARDGLAVAVGRAPGALDQRLETGGAIPLPPAEVLIGDPTGMIARRPDIRAAEQRLRQANAAIGAAQAARMPRVSLAGVIGLGGAAKGDWTTSDNLFSLAAPTLQWNVADFGRGKSGVNQALAGRAGAEATYEATVLAALQDAEGSLNRYGEARNALAASARATGSARQSAELSNSAWRAGRTSALSALGADMAQLAAEDALVQARANLTVSYVALQKALASGWTTQTL
jgi:NodT family efflux transporter outer membrane factor (OMF) lipoprotein